jgi:hypothetical protein
MDELRQLHLDQPRHEKRRPSVIERMRDAYATALGS